MNLIVDLGNTRSKLFLFEKDKLLSSLSFPKLKVDDLKGVFKKYPVGAAVISSVVKNDSAIRAFLKKNSFLIELKSSVPLPVKIKYKTPATLGNDRIANAVGGAKLFPKKNVLVIDAGTCIKYDFVNSKGEYLGGSISPGLMMRFEALNYFTDKLPLVRLEVLDSARTDRHTERSRSAFIGSSTKKSIITGVQQGIINEMNGFEELYRGRFRSLHTILTGGDADRFARELNFPIFAAPELIGQGLNEILQYNLPKK